MKDREVKPGRPPLVSDAGERLIPYTVKLWSGQVDALREMGTGNASAWLRDLVDANHPARTKKRKRGV